MRPILLYPLFWLVLACQGTPGTGPDATPSPHEAKVLPQSVSASERESAQPQTSVPSKRISPPADQPAKARTPLVSAWDLKEQRIQSKRAEYQRMLPIQQQKFLEEAIRNLMDRHKCNTVMGCLAEEEVVAAGVDGARAIMEAYPTISRDSYNKFHLLDVLGEIGAPESGRFLADLLSAPQWNARANAAFALGRLKPASFVDQLEKHLTEAKAQRDMAVAYSLAYALESAGTGRGKSLLLDALDPKNMAGINWGYTRYAVEALALLGIVEACPKLLPALTHRDQFLRKEALRAVARLRCPQSVVLDAVAQSLEDAAPGVRTQAAETLLWVTKMPIKTVKSWNQYKKHVLEREE